MFGMPVAVNHIAITMPSREAWLQHLEYLQKKGVKFDRRVEHGMTHSLYIHDPNGYGVEFVYDLPKEIWKDDIDAALNFVKVLPTEGKEALDDRTEGVPHFSKAAAPAAEESPARGPGSGATSPGSQAPHLGPRIAAGLVSSPQ